MGFEFEGADGVSNSLDGIRLAMGPIIGGIDAPFIPGAVMSGVQYAVHDRIAQVDIARGHVYFGPQSVVSFLKLSGPHPFEKLQILLHRTIPIGAHFTGLLKGTTVLPDFIGA